MRKTLLVFPFILLIFMLPLVKAQEINSLELIVDPTGYVKVIEVVDLDNYSVVNVVPLLAKDVDALIVVDGKGNPLPYNLNGSYLEILGNSSMANITYYTASLTSKMGEVWSLRFNSNVSAKIVLPEGAIIVDLSDIPLEIAKNYIVMPPGNVSVSYILPPPSNTETATSSTSSSNLTVPTQRTSTTRSGNPSAAFTSSTSSSASNTRALKPVSTSTSGGNGLPLSALVFLSIVIALTGGLWYLKTKRRSSNEMQKVSREEFERKLESLNLNDEEKRALLYIYERGGRARQSDVRTDLGIPKTTAWRMFQRLEKQGLVRIYKKGRENWVELRF